MKNVKTGHQKPIVCLDAGHYGKYNRSPAFPSYYESDMNWKLHLLLKNDLESYGIEVVTTRKDKDKDLSLFERGFASKGCDLFISIHSNAVGSSANEKVDYVSVYCLEKDTSTKIDDNSRELAKMLAPVIAKTMNVNQGGRVLTRKAATDKNGDGVLNDNYYGVLNGARQAETAGLIVEHSFHTNTRIAKWLSSESNLKTLAVEEAKVIAEYFGVSKKNKTSNVSIDLPVLRNGDSGGAVFGLQALLAGHGYDLGKCGVDGQFGSKTLEAVKKHQKKNGLSIDGVVGEKTWKSLIGVD